MREGQRNLDELDGLSDGRDHCSILQSTSFSHLSILVTLVVLLGVLVNSGWIDCWNNYTNTNGSCENSLTSVMYLCETYLEIKIHLNGE